MGGVSKLAGGGALWSTGSRGGSKAVWALVGPRLGSAKKSKRSERAGNHSEGGPEPILPNQA
eukprot:5247774-Pyramimonas_sp.AAC.1